MDESENFAESEGDDERRRYLGGGLCRDSATRTH